MSSQLTPETAPCKPLSGPKPLSGAPTGGPKVVRWIEKHCVYGEGDKFGQPVRLEPFQRHFLHHLYRVNPATGFRQYRRAFLEVPA